MALLIKRLLNIEGFRLIYNKFYATDSEITYAVDSEGVRAFATKQ